MTTIDLLFNLVVIEGLYLEQMDEKTTFLHGGFEEDIYMAEPTCFKEESNSSRLVCKLKKSLLFIWHSGLQPQISLNIQAYQKQVSLHKRINRRRWFGSEESFW